MTTHEPEADSLATPAAGRVLVSFLDRGRTVDRFGTLLVGVAAAWLATLSLAGALAGTAFAPMATRLAAGLLWLSLACALAQKYHAWRVRIDAALFRGLYATGPVDMAALRALDDGLASVLAGAGAASRIDGRSLAQRWRGALRLWRRQIAWCAAQAVFMLAAGALMIDAFILNR